MSCSDDLSRRLTTAAAKRSSGDYSARSEAEWWGPGVRPALKVMLVAFLPLLGELLLLAPPATEAQSPPAALLFSPPLGYRDGTRYGPRITYSDGSLNLLIENTDYGILNPDLQGNTCFGRDWSQIYHAGEDWYRSDGSSTFGAEVTSVADGKVLFANPINYPGRVVIIQHLLPSGQNVYSMYGHIGNLAVSSGQIVTRGQRLGTVIYQPYTGRYPEYHPSGDDSHLHFEIRYFYDGSNIYTDYPACNGIIPGRGYTYPDHPDNFPAPGAGYTDPTTFLQNRAGAFLPLVMSDYAACSEGAELIQNGDFEQGRTIWTEQGSSIIRTDLPTPAHGGSWAAWFGGYNNARDVIRQDFSVPPNTDSITLTYHIWMRTAEAPSTAYDYFYAHYRDTSGSLILTFDQIDNTAPENTWIQRVVVASGLSLSTTQTFRLSFEATTDATLITDFVVDDVSLVAPCGPAAGPSGVAPVHSTPVRHAESPGQELHKP